MGNENLENHTLTDEELALFLKEIGVSDERETKAPLDALPGDILEKTAFSPIDPLNMDLEERPKRTLFPLWLSLCILLTFFMGSLFGFFWGQQGKPQNESIPEKQTEIVILLEEVKNLCLKILETQSDSHEILEPLEPPTEMEKLAPTVLS